MHLFRLAALFLLSILLTSCQQAPQLVKLSGEAQGTSWHISYWNNNDADAGKVKQQIDAEFVRIDKLMSNYRDDSVISQFNQQQDNTYQTVGTELVQLIEQARLISNASHGCYDLTVKPLFDLWGFRANQFNHPSAEQIDTALLSTGMRHLGTTTTDKVAKAITDLTVDVSSIAQGYTVERLSVVLQNNGIKHFMAEIGGELLTQGHKPDGKAWRIAIERPLPGSQQLHKVLQMSTTQRAAVMTSGTYRHYFTADGQRFSHILDARTGKPVLHDTVSVTLVHDNATLADAWSTALLCSGYEQGMAIATDQNLAVLFIVEKNGALVEHASPAWQQNRLFSEVK